MLIRMLLTPTTMWFESVLHLFNIWVKNVSYLLVHLDVEPVWHFVVLKKTKIKAKSKKGFSVPHFAHTKHTNGFMWTHIHTHTHSQRDSPWHSVSASQFSHWPVSHTPISDCEAKGKCYVSVYVMINTHSNPKY